ncbi:hypothetical protein [Streptomyces bacillaris]|uniref:hypothetical protein n=1 Tax=Streptomyces bacillaris TaxID=68179 RepID=UPI003EBB5827
MSDAPSTPPTAQPYGPNGPVQAAGWSAIPPRPPLPTTGKPSRRRAWLTHGATAFVALVIGAAMGGGGGSGSTTDSARPAPAATVTKTADAPAPEPAATVTEKVTVTPKPTKEPGPAASVAGDGTYLVGEDMKAGTYMSAGPADSAIPNCYWARLKDASGEFDAIIANGNAQGQARVTVRKGEYFQTSGCETWKKVG